MNLNGVFHSQTKSITFAAFLMAISSAISGILGLFRDGLLAGAFGVWSETNPYFAAFKINDFFYNLLIIGGLAVAFLPLFSEYYSQKREKAWEMVSNVLNIFLLFLLLAALLIFIFAPSLVKIIAFGFSPQDQQLAASLIRIMILSPIFFGLSAIFSGVIQYFNRFFVYALAPILYNLGIIFGIIFLSPYFGITGVCMGVVLGAAMHWLIQVPSAINCGFRYKFLFDLGSSAIRRIFILALPRLFAVGGQQVNLLFITAIASNISGGVTIFSFANNISYYPIGIIGVSFAIASFPVLSKNWAEGEKKKFLDNFSSVFRQILFLIAPLTVLLFVLRVYLVRLIFGTLGDGKFDWIATRLTAASLGLFAISIFASALIPLISRAFFSLQDTRTPTLISLFSVILNIFLAVFFVWYLGYSSLFQDLIRGLLELEGVVNISIIGLPLAFSLAAIFQFILLLALFSKKVKGFELKKVFLSMAKIILISLIAGFITYLLLYLIGNFVDNHTVFGIFFQTIISALIGLGAYFVSAYFLKLPELSITVSSFRKQFRKEIIPAEIEITRD